MFLLVPAFAGVRAWHVPYRFEIPWRVGCCTARAQDAVSAEALPMSYS
jgi:hypothetical protein